MLSYSSTIQTDLKVYNSVFITDHPLYASVIVIGDANVIPVAYPDAYNVNQNDILTVTAENGVLSNDIDTDNILTSELVSDVSNGTLVFNNNGSFTYTPNELYYGQDSFTYRVFDRKAYSNIETVIITVNQVITWSELIAYTHEERVIADGGAVLDKPQLITDLDAIGEVNYNNLTFLMNSNGGSKASKIHAIKPENGTADLMVDRNSEASYVAEDGIKFANANEPRFNLDGSLLVEPQRINYLEWSEDVSVWTAYNNGIADPVVRTYNVASSPTGYMNADRVQLSKNGGTSFSDEAYINLTFNPILKGVASLYLRSYNGQNQTLYFRTGAFPYTVFNISTEWQRFILPFNTGSSINYIRLGIRGGDFGGATNSDIADFLISNTQVEEGSSATSYIKTEGATKTRLKDTITVVPPAGTTQIIETIDGVEQPPITTIPATYEVSEGNINQIKML